MRLDKLLCEMNFGSRREVRELMKKGLVLVDGCRAASADMSVEEEKVRITYRGQTYAYKPFVYYLLNKPAGVVSATRDREKTVLDVLKEQLAAGGNADCIGIPIRDIFPVGRLDKDTCGLLLLTNDGALAHRLLSPAKEIPKTYYAETDVPVSEEGLKELEQGIRLEEGSLTKPAKAVRLGETKYLLTITEGKYHQVKRMFLAVGSRVLFLKRLSVGNFHLEDDWEEGTVRELTKEEVEKLC